ncbi:hypothetical protein RFI_18142 [Reticulomyxa filosa]|uniref:Uncharacterized protein n=1 Tax=Reticulomyxa filosa TaxID=46433 RepID=X6N025_RETFI|nr:hypothetical protein RFI_18142 [Reticulomyxa filosa]|eukprot:ETO19094.1 hypothetical protein RFI_18142 [Reticulomyxa filosa]
MELKKNHLWGLYFVAILMTVATVGVSGWFASAAACLQYFRVKDFTITPSSTSEVNGKRVYWICRRDLISFEVNSAIGIGGVIILNLIIGYMYITRMIYTARAVHRNEELDLAHIKNNPSSHEISNETMQILIHVRKCGIIALTSITCSLISCAIALGLSAVVSIFIDCFFNGVLMLSSFTFAENMFKYCFGCCGTPFEILLSRLIKST